MGQIRNRCSALQSLLKRIDGSGLCLMKPVLTGVAMPLSRYIKRKFRATLSSNSTMALPVAIPATVILLVLSHLVRKAVLYFQLPSGLREGHMDARKYPPGDGAGGPQEAFLEEAPSVHLIDRLYPPIISREKKIYKVSKFRLFELKGLRQLAAPPACNVLEPAPKQDDVFVNIFDEQVQAWICSEDGGWTPLDVGDWHPTLQGCQFFVAPGKGARFVTPVRYAALLSGLP
ncbi:hypothetical protein BC834DRAFT_893825 [Gloeopeniophorella convolvens]|nr:hypothetical protein BC834DRAFT_893825 [Gloeopeniophorella convolvens]